MSYPEPPPNVKYWGYSPELKDSRWWSSGRVGGNTTLGMPGVTPDEDNMKVIAANYWLKDEDDVSLQRPAFLILLFVGGTPTSPIGAKELFRTSQYYIKRVNNVPHSGDGWQRIVFDVPVELPKNKQVWIFVDDYNGTNRQTWHHHAVHNNPDQIGIGHAYPHILKGLDSNKVIVNSAQYYRHFAVNLEYITEKPIPPKPKPTLTVDVQGSRFDLKWTQKSHEGKYPIKYEGEYYVTDESGVTVDPLQNLEKEETGPFTIIDLPNGYQQGNYPHIHQHHGIFIHYFFITAIWEDGTRVQTSVFGRTQAEPDPEPKTIEEEVAELKVKVEEHEARIQALENK